MTEKKKGPSRESSKESEKRVGPPEPPAKSSGKIVKGSGTLRPTAAMRAIFEALSDEIVLKGYEPTVVATRGQTVLTTADIDAIGDKLKSWAKEMKAQGKEAVILESMKQDIELRKKFAYWLIGIFTAATVVTLGLFIANGFGWTNLSDPALIALQAGTVAEIAGILVIVAKYLFPQ